MTVADQKKIDSLYEEIKGLQSAVRRQAEEMTQDRSILSSVRNRVELHESHLKSLELRTEKLSTPKPESF